MWKHMFKKHASLKWLLAEIFLFALIIALVLLLFSI